MIISFALKFIAIDMFKVVNHKYLIAKHVMKIVTASVMALDNYYTECHKQKN